MGNINAYIVESQSAKSNSEMPILSNIDDKKHIVLSNIIDKNGCVLSFIIDKTVFLSVKKNKRL